MRLQEFLADELVRRVTAGAELDFVPKLGSNVFIAYSPAGVSECLLLTITIPLNANHYSNVFTGSSQVLYRSSSPVKSSKIMRQVSEIFSGFDIGSLETDSVRVLKVLPRTEPLLYQRQDDGSYEASVNFDVKCVYK